MWKTVVLVFLHTFFLLALTSQDKATLIKIGALYNKETESLKSVLDDVFKNELPRILKMKGYRLVLTPLRVDGKDLLSKEVASNFSSVFSIIDLACKDAKAFALSSLLQVPLIKVDAIEDETPHKYAVSIRPSYRVVSKALFDVMKFYSFNRVAVVYDARKSRQASVFYASARKWTQYNAEMMPELPLDNTYKLREALTALLKSHIKQVILFSDQRDLTKIMNEALFVGINDKDLKWIASDLEVAGPNKTYPAIFGMVGLSLYLGNQIAAMDYEKRASEAIQRGALEYSLAMYAAVYDTAVVVGKAMETILTNTTGRKMIHSYGNYLNCPLRSMVKEGEGLGQRILHELRKVSFKGLTGDVRFDGDSGERMVQDGMDILNVLPQDVKKIGSWKPVPGENEASVLPMNSEEPDWLGCFYESVKCHNPGVPGPRPKVRLPKLSITTVLCALKRRLSRSCKPREESSVPNKTTPVRVAVVLSQGDKVLRRTKEKPTSTAWNKLFG